MHEPELRPSSQWQPGESNAPFLSTLLLKWFALFLHSTWFILMISSWSRRCEQEQPAQAAVPDEIKPKLCNDVGIEDEWSFVWFCLIIRFHRAFFFAFECISMISSSIKLNKLRQAKKNVRGTAIMSDNSNQVQSSCVKLRVWFQRELDTDRKTQETEADLHVR